MTTAKESLLSWLADGDLLRVCAGLAALGKHHRQAELSGQAALQAGRYRQLRSQRHQNLVDQDDYQHELAKIRQTLYEQILGLPDDWSAEPLANIPPSAAGVTSRPFPWKTTALVVAGALGLALLVIQLSQNKTSLTETQNPAANHTTVDNPRNQPAQTAAAQPTDNSPEKPAQQPVSKSNPPANPGPANTPGQPAENQSSMPNRQTAPPPDEGPLTVKCRTNKGRDDVNFKKDQTVRLYATANQACYLRTLYRLADNTLILLDDNRQISPAQAGQEVEIGSGFVVDAPYG
ncbi:MAG: hypothetical protein JNK89_04610, partial [Saprospiraceae bacterium]|nr:hypothetical protein [Saprospiraceae bacterium]